MIDSQIIIAALGEQSYSNSCSYNENLYLKMRKLYLSTSGTHNWEVNKRISRIRPIRSKYPSASGGLVPLRDISNAIKSLFDSGYYTTRISLPDDYYTQLISLINGPNSSNHKDSARRFLASWSALSSSSLIQALLSDSSIKLIADQYLRCNSILNSIRAWKTTYKPRSFHNISSDAMRFHFDSDHNRFIKIFLYLDDVDFHNGPHIYIPYTNMFYRHKLHPNLQIDGRLSDCLILNHGLLPEVIIGKRGTIVFADTHNLHRGSLVSKNHERNILQLQFVDSIFGAIPQYDS